MSNTSGIDPSDVEKFVAGIRTVAQGMKIKIHLNNQSGIVVEVPIRDLMQNSKDHDDATVFQSSSMEKLHLKAILALFSMHMARDPMFKVPEYAFSHFGTSFTYHQESRIMTIESDDSLAKAIQYGAENRMFDENDNIILDCFCTIKNIYISNVDKQLNELFSSSARIVDKTVNSVKHWVNRVRKSKGWFRSESARDQGMSLHVERFLQFILNPKSKDTSSFQDRSLIIVTSAISSALLARISATVGQLINHWNEVIETDDYSMTAESISPSVFEKLNKSCSYVSNKSADGMVKRDNFSESPEAIEIVFDCQENRTPAEWSLFFQVAGSDTLQSLSSNSSQSKDCEFIDEDEGIISLDASSVSSNGLDEAFDTTDDAEDQGTKADAQTSIVMHQMDMSFYPYDEERSMDGVLVSADADVSFIMDDSSEADSWTEWSDDEDN